MKPVRKAFFVLILAVLVLFGVHALADTTVALEPVSGEITLGNNYVVLTSSNLAEHKELLSSLGKTQEEVEADWAARGVLMQAWTSARDICIEFTAVQDDESKTYFDLDQQSSRVRNEYRSMHLKDARFNNDQFDVKTAAWKMQSKGGRFLILKYKADVNGASRWGYSRKTIRNGYTVALTWQLLTDRALRASDEKAMNVIANTITFQKKGEALSNTSALVHFSEEPPTETNSDTFTVKGNCASGAHIIAVLMRMSSSNVVKLETDANKKGDFKFKVKLPEEGVWVMSLTFDVNDQTVAEHAFHATTYNKALLPVSFTSPVPEVISGDELVISGVTSKAVTVQCIVSNGTSTYTKQIKTNGSGKFNFKVPATIEGTYDTVLSFSKKGMNDRRFTFTSTRTITEQDTRVRVRSEAIKPAYSVLKSKINGYVSKVMTYNVYITDISQLGEEWIIRAAMKSSTKGYSDMIVIVAREDPGFETGSQHRFYGTCIGLYQEQSEEGTSGDPSFDLLFWE